MSKINKFFIMLVLFSLSTIITNAQSGTCGQNLTWNLSNDKLTISGTGNMTNYTYDDRAPWYSYVIREIEITNGVTSIGNYAFQYCVFTSFIAPNSLLTIGEAAFYSCDNITTISLPNVTTIGNNAFYGISLQSLNNADIPSVITIGSYAFAYSDLQTVNLSGIISMGDYVFQNCFSLTSANLTGVTSIGEGTFSYCRNLAGINLPYVTTIGRNAFAGCTSLQSLETANIPSMTTVGDYAFDGSGLQTINLPYVTAIGDYAFYNCDLTTINLPNVTVIGNNTFAYNNNLTNITLPSAVSIGNSAFSYCNNLATISFPNVTTIGENAFSGCSSFQSLETASIPSMTIIGTSTFARSGLQTINLSNVTGIGNNAFSFCSNLVSINLPNVINIGDGAFNSCTALGSITIPSGVTNIGNNVFEGCTNLVSVAIPNEVTSIGYNAFRSCTNLASITIPSSVTDIGSSAFMGCTSLIEITIPENVTRIEGTAFSGCTSLTTVNFNAVNCTYMAANASNSVFKNCNAFVTLNMGNSVKSIPNYAFNGCSGLTYISFPESLLTIGSAAFVGNNFTELSIPESVTSIASGAFNSQTLTTLNYNAANATTVGYSSIIVGNLFTTLNIGENVQAIPNYAFSACTTLNNVNFTGNNITTIGDLAFRNCSSLTSITIPNSVTNINLRAFGNSGLTSVTIPAGVTTIEANAFENCTNLTEVYYNAINCNMSYHAFTGSTSFATLVIGNGVTTIPAQAFQYSSLTSVTIGEDVTSIDQAAFYGCGISSLTIPESVTSIGNQAFVNCTNLETVYFNATNCTTMGSSNGPVFQGCTAFETLNIGENVTNIPDYAFRYCSALANVNFSSNNITDIGDYAFHNCGITGDFIIPASVEAIGKNAFSGAAFSSVTIPESTTSIKSDAFMNCTNVEYVNYNAINCTYLEGWMFQNCNVFASLNIGENVTHIPEGAFRNCSSLTTLDFSNAANLTNIGISAFYGIGLTSVTIPESITRISGSAFSNCENLITVNYNAINASTGGYKVFESCPNFTQLSIGENVTIIPSYLFGSCTGLTSVVIPENVTMIEYAAFDACPNIETLTLPSTLTEIEHGAFYNSNNISELTTNAQTPPIIGSSAFPVSVSTSVFIPCLTYDIYRNNNQWSYYFRNFTVVGPVSDTTYYYASKCYNTSYSDENFTNLYYTGNHYITLENQYNCDSVVCLVLSEYDYIQPYTYPASVCQGGSYSDENFTGLTTAGYHSVTLQNINNCDSIVQVNLSIVPAPVYNYPASFCQGSSYSDENFTDLTTAGTHSVTLQTVASCDSIVNINLSIIPAPIHNYSVTICSGSSYSDANFSDLTVADNYSITLQTASGCDSIVNLQLSLLYPPEQELCMISVDMEYHNQIIWKRQEEITAYNIYREGNTVGQYDLAATIPYEETNSWIDIESNARVRSYNYKISAIDTCGNESELSSPHKTMHLTINQGVGNSWNLIWTPYEGTGYSTYNIYRAVGETFGELELISTIPSSLSSFSDFVSAENAYVYYMVEIVLDEACEVGPVISTKSIELKLNSSEVSFASIRSNIATNNPNDIITGLENINTENSVRIYPNPVRDKLIIDYNELIINNVQIIDLSGKTVLQFNDSRSQINVSTLTSGIYFVKIEMDKGFVIDKFVKE